MYQCDGSLAIRESAGADGRLRLALSGCLDIATAPLLDARLRELDGDTRRIELDLEHLNFIDLQGLRVIHMRLLGVQPGPALEVRPKPNRCVRRLAALTEVELWPVTHPGVAAGELRPVRRIRLRTQVPRRGRVARR